MTTAVAVRERPILFSGEMVRAILDGRKTQTRRVVKPQPERDLGYMLIDGKARPVGADYPDTEDEAIACKYGVVGDWLYVREAYRLFKTLDALPASKIPRGRLGRISFEADAEARPVDGRLRAARFMPRRFSRIALDITNVRVERLQAITSDDARAEGMLPGARESETDAYHNLWDSLNAKRGYSWESNPWVFVIEFARVTA